MIPGNGKPAMGVTVHRIVTRLVLSILVCACPLAQGAAQSRAKPPREKPPIDSAAIKQWYGVGRATISPDGQYVSYTITNRPVDAQTLVVQSTRTAWKQEFPNGSAAFSDDSRHLMVLTKEHQLCVVALATRRSECVNGVASYRRLVSRQGEWLVYQLEQDHQLCFRALGTSRSECVRGVAGFSAPTAATYPYTLKGEWLAYQFQGDSQVVVVRNVATGAERRFAGVAEHTADAGGKVLVVRTETPAGAGTGSATNTAVQWVNLATGRARTIWSSATAVAGGYVFDSAGGQLAFFAHERSGDSSANALWYYKVGMDHAVPRVTRQSAAPEPGWVVAGPAEFIAGGRYLSFALRRPAPAPPARMPQANGVMVDIWSTTDRWLRFPESRVPDERNSFRAAISTAGGAVIRLEGRAEHGGARIVAASSSGSDFVVVLEDPPAGNVLEDIYAVDDFWIDEPTSYDLVSLRDGTKTRLASSIPWFSFWFSPGGRYLLYYDPATEQYYSRDLVSGDTRPIAQAIPDKLSYHISEAGIPTRHNKQPSFATGIAGWLPGDAAVLIYGDYDIWRVDPAGKQPPINVTQGYGSSHHVRFELAAAAAGRGYFSSLVLQPTESVLLTASSPDTKATGFYRTSLTGRHAPEQLTMGPYQYGPPVKAAKADQWIVPRESATEAPNYFLTSDFKRYQALTDVQPHQAYNWLTADLLSFRQLDGIPTQAVLYKPENFDPRQKYPVIFLYYENHKAELLHQYPWPGFSGGEINIPWFVSRGYVVVTPDIHYTVGHTGQSAYNSIVAAAQYVSQLPWVDTTRLGLQGHSFGGYETQYLITHSHLFAAAVAAAGPSNLISGYADYMGGGVEFTEMSQPRMGASLWERPDLYIENSPIFKVDQITTPLLMMHNLKDENVEWHHGRELFLGLRRTGKTAWWLQYDNGAHGVAGKEAEDYTWRMTQFFDHYLKGVPAPEWMQQASSGGALVASPAPPESLQRSGGHAQAQDAPSPPGREP